MKKTSLKDKLSDNKAFMGDLRLVGKVFGSSSGLKLLLKWRRQFVEAPKFDPESSRNTDFNLGKEDFVLGIMTDLDNLERLEGYIQGKLDAVAKTEKDETVLEVEPEDDEPDLHVRLDSGMGSTVPQGKG